MAGDPAHRLGSLIYPLLERFSHTPWNNAPRPESRAVARGAGHDPDRVLLTGGSSSVGWGVLSHDLALAGHLARITAAATGRGIDVEVNSHPRLSTADIQAFLTPATISRYDAIVLTLGGRESFELLPTRIWRREVTALLDHITTGREIAPAVIIVGAEETSPVRLPPAMAGAAMGRARALNAATREIIAGRPRIVFVNSAMVPHEGEPPNVLDIDSSLLYERAARAIAPTLAALLDGAHDRLRQPVDEDARLEAVRYAQSAEVRDDPRIAQLLATAKDVLHARSVDFFFVGRDEVRLLAATNETEIVAPRESSLSNEVLEYRRGFVIPDLAADPRHRDRSQVVGPPYLRFYAGHPVESPDGHRIGVLAVVDTKPRTFSPAELSLLRNFAVRAGVLLFDR